jgi:hypothetical protein
MQPLERLAETESPVAALEPRAGRRAYERDGFVVTLWTYYAPVTARGVAPADYAKAAIGQARFRTAPPAAPEAPPGQGRRTAAGARRACSNSAERPRRRLSGQALRRSTWPRPPHAKPQLPAREGSVCTYSGAGYYGTKRLLSPAALARRQGRLWVCAVPRRRFPVGASPTRRFAPAGSNRSKSWR